MSQYMNTYLCRYIYIYIYTYTPIWIYIYTHIHMMKMGPTATARLRQRPASTSRCAASNNNTRIPAILIIIPIYAQLIIYSSESLRAVLMYNTVILLIIPVYALLITIIHMLAFIYGQSPYLHCGFQGGWLQHNLNLKGWNSHAHRGFPGKFESSNVSRDNVSREIGCNTHVGIHMQYVANVQ